MIGQLQGIRCNSVRVNIVVSFKISDNVVNCLINYIIIHSTFALKIENYILAYFIQYFECKCKIYSIFQKRCQNICSQGSTYIEKRINFSLYKLVKNKKKLPLPLSPCISADKTLPTSGKLPFGA